MNERSPFVMRSALSSEECARRLSATVAEKNMGPFNFGDWDGTEIYGRIEGDRIELRKRRSFFWRNDFAPHLFAQLTPLPGGTKIVGHFGTAQWLLKLHRIAITVGGAFAAFIFIGALRQFLAGVDSDNMVPALLFPPLMILMVWIQPVLGYSMSRGHEKVLLDFLRTTLEAD